jgi:hypothetical protein
MYDPHATFDPAGSVSAGQAMASPLAGLIKEQQKTQGDLKNSKSLARKIE